MKFLGRVTLVTLTTFSLVLAGGVSAKAADPAPCTPITTQLKSKKLGKLYAYAVNLSNQKVLVNVRANSQTPSASVMKAITAAAALKFVVKPREVAQLAPYTAKTSVLTLPDEPGTLILRGGGDHTLTRVAPNAYTSYYLPGEHPVKLRNLASQALAAMPADVPITKIILDDTFFKGPTWNANWYAYSRTVGDASPITGLMVDAGRKNPDLTDKKYSGYRVTDPTLQSGQFFKKWLGERAVNAILVKGSTPVTATELTYGNSQPITNWMVHALKISDNTETEVIARHTELAMGLTNKYTSAQTMGKRLFTALGVDGSKLIMKDASGLAPGNRVTAKMLVGLMSAAANPESDIAALPSMMATSGSGTLNGRFLNYNKTTKSYYRVIPAGAIRAKTGYIGSVYALSGLVTTPEGNQIAFAIFARSAPSEGFRIGTGTKQAIDNVVEKLYLCGATL